MKAPILVTETIHGDESQKGLLAGVKILHDPVASTLGASGRTVIIEDIYGYPRPTKDGVTVAKSIVPFDSVERMGCEIIKQASLNTAAEAGDGTTTATIIAKAVIDGGLEAMKDKSVNYTDFNRGMQLAVNYICEELDKDAIKVDHNNILSVATISANNDGELGGVIAEAFKRAGEHGVVLMEKSQTSDTFVSSTDGFELENGYRSEVFVNVKDANRVEYSNPLILVSNVKIERFNQIEPFAARAITLELPLVIVSEMDDMLLDMLAMNNTKGNLKVVVIEPSHFGVRRRDILNDLAIATGSTLIDDQTGDNLDVIDFNHLGTCTNMVSDRRKTIFFNEINDETVDHIEGLKSHIKAADSAAEKKYLEERIAKISSAVSVINVGASSSTEQSEKADRVDDAIHATRAAIEEGIVAGGGIALHNCTLGGGNYKPHVEPAVQAGFDCVMKAIVSPLKIILSNGDVEYQSAAYTRKNTGLDIKNRVMGNMFEMEIIDPVKVTKTALRNAVSAASTLLSTTTTIVKLRKI